MPRNTVACLAAAITLAALTAVSGSASTGHAAFYLTVHPKQCLVGSTSSGNHGYKTVLVVPCFDASHNLEVYVIGHGGWGHATPPPLKSVFATMRTICVAAYQRLTGHPLRMGWDGFAPDPGAETARYGDKIICSLRTYPRFGALGGGWHVH